jgi:multiple sugar transport system substrate-binding protein
MRKLVFAVLLLGVAPVLIFSAPVSLTYWNIMAPGPTKDLMEKLGREFEGLHPNVKITMEFTQHRDYESKLPTAIASGTAPDIWSQSYRLVEKYKENLDPITADDLKAMGYASMEALLDTWEPGTLEQYAYDGKYYGMMWQYNLFGYGINRRYFKEAGLDPDRDYPKTWDDTIRLGKRLVKKEGGRIMRQAMSFPYNYPGIWYFMEFQPMLVELGGSVMNKEGTECLINSPEAVRAMTEIKRRFDEGLVDKDISVTMDYMDGFRDGHTAIAITNVIEWPNMWAKVNPASMKDNVRVQNNPTFLGKAAAAGVSSWGHSVNKNSKAKGGAWMFIDYLTKDANRNLIETGGLIPRKGWAKTEGARLIPNPALVAEMLKKQFPSGLLKDFTEISEPIKKAMQAILYQDADIQTTLDKVKVEIDNTLKQ